MIPAVGVSFARLYRREISENGRSLAIFDRKEIAHPEAFKNRDLQGRGTNRRCNRRLVHSGINRLCTMSNCLRVTGTRSKEIGQDDEKRQDALDERVRNINIRTRMANGNLPPPLHHDAPANASTNE